MDVLSVVVPIRNDERRIRATCLDIAHAVRPLVWDGSIADYEIILVDDASTDETGASADVFAKRDRNVVVAHRDTPGGFDAAVATGLAIARGNLVAHGSARNPLAAEALRPAIDRLRADGLRTVTVKPGLSRFVPGGAGASLKLIQRHRSAAGEMQLPRRSAHAAKRARVGIAAVAAIGTAVALVAVVFLSGGRTPVTTTDRETFVGRHGRVAVEQAPPAAKTPSNSMLPAQAVKVAPPAKPTRAVKTVVASITPEVDSTCGTDVTKSLQSALDGAPNGSTIDLQPHGCYLIGGGLSLAHLSDLTIDGRGAELRSGALTCSASSAISLSDLTITAPDGAPAMLADRCSSITISSVHLAGSDYGLRLTGGSHDITVHALTTQTDHMPLEISAAERVVFDAASLTSVRDVAVAIDPAQGATVKDIEIRNSTLTSPIRDIAGVGDGLISDIWVHDNQLLGGRSKILVLADSATPSQTWRIYRNRGDLTQTLHAYVNITNANDVLVANNVLQATVVPLRAAIRFTNAQGDLAVLTNDFTGACHPYYEDTRSAPVRSQGNKVSNC